MFVVHPNFPRIERMRKRIGDSIKGANLNEK
jgi:hypothetical protein